VLSRDEVFAKIDELLEVGGDLVGFNGGFNPRLPLDYYCDLFAAVRERYGDRVEFYALTIAEFLYLADRAELSYPEAAGGCATRASTGSRRAARRSSRRTSASATPSSSTRCASTSRRSARSSTAA
jgi:2-iminoacetate synthase ThiH